MAALDVKIFNGTDEDECIVGTIAKNTIYGNGGSVSIVGYI